MASETHPVAFPDDQFRRDADRCAASDATVVDAPLVTFICLRHSDCLPRAFSHSALVQFEVPKFKGKTVSTEDFYFNPEPVQQPHPPYIIGGKIDAARLNVPAAWATDGTGLPNSSTRHSNWCNGCVKSNKATTARSRWNSRWGRNGAAPPSTMSGGSRKPVLSGSCPRGWSHATHLARCAEFTKRSCRSSDKFRGLT